MRTRFTSCIPVITVRDLMQAREFYTGALGFALDFVDDDVVGLIGGEVQVYLISVHSPNRRQEAGSANLVFLVDDVDRLYAHCRDYTNDIVEEPRDRAYGQRDFAIRDPDGNVLNFACTLR